MIKVMIKGCLLSRVRIVSDFQFKSSPFFCQKSTFGAEDGLNSHL